MLRRKHEKKRHEETDAQSNPPFGLAGCLWQGEDVRAFAFRLLAWVLLPFGMGCKGVASEEVPMPVAAALPSSSSSSAPRRPTLRHYLARTAERCEVYSVDHDEVSPALRTPCPQDLQIGERIRVAGKTCLREGHPSRIQPVVCPGILIDADNASREKRDGG
jgi:hypothetical protein